MNHQTEMKFPHWSCEIHDPEVELEILFMKSIEVRRLKLDVGKLGTMKT